MCTIWKWYKGVHQMELLQWCALDGAGTGCASDGAGTWVGIRWHLMHIPVPAPSDAHPCNSSI